MSELNSEAVRSLHAINQWVDVIESNINGTQRTAYKKKTPTFTMDNKNLTGTVSSGFRPKNQIGDVMLPSASLEISDVRSDFSQGAIIQTTERTNLAIQGVGFFVCTNTLDFSNTGVEMTQYYTRDGEFQWDTQGYLRTSNGLYVVNKAFPPFAPQQATIQANIAAGTDSASNYFVSKTRTLSVGPPPTTAADIDVNSEIDVDKVGLARFPQDNGLEYTKYGTSYLVEGGASGRPLFFSTADPGVDTMIKTGSLETSNGSMTEYIPMLASSQKMFSAVSKIIAVYNSTVDDMNALVH